MEDKNEAIENEIGALRRKIIELSKEKEYQFAPASKEPPRISIGVTREEFGEITELARRCSTSVSALGQLAFRHLLIQARSGAVPMLPPHQLNGD